MSYPQGDHAPKNGTRNGQQRPSFDRPSLFAGMEGDAASDDTQRVRILSTLESTRRSSRPKRTAGGRRTHKTHRSAWMHGALWGALGIGVIALMAGFVMVIQDAKPALASASPAQQPEHPLVKADPRQTANVQPMAATADASPAAVAANVATRPPAVAPAGPAVIETLASPDALPTATTGPAEAPARSVVAQTAINGDPVAHPQSKAPAAAASAAKPGVAGGTVTARTPKAAKGQDEDVALLEAMFQHTGRKATSQPARK